MSGKGYSAVIDGNPEHPITWVKIVNSSSNRKIEQLMMVTGDIVGVHNEGNTIVVSALPKGATAPVVTKLEIDYRAMSVDNQLQIAYQLMNYDGSSTITIDF